MESAGVEPPLRALSDFVKFGGGIPFPILPEHIFFF